MKNPEIRLSDHFTYCRLLRFTMPTVLMMLFASIYVVADGLFVANGTGKTAFAAVNLIWPFPMIIGALGYMFGTGGCALVSKILGEGDAERARGYFSMIVLVAFTSGVLLASFGYIYVEDMSRLLGAEGGIVLDSCVSYGQLIMTAIPLFIMQVMFQPFMIAAEKPKWGLTIIIFAGVVNVILDYILIIKFNQGVAGAGYATLISQAVGALLPILFFWFLKPLNLYFSLPRFNWKALWRACVNGSSEFIINASMPIVNLLYVGALWRIGGEDAVGAYGVIMYVNVVFFSVYTGFSMGSAPIVSYNFGAGVMKEVRNIRRLMVRLLSCSSLAIFAVAEFLAPMVAWSFAGGDSTFEGVIYEAFALYSVSFLFAPFNIYASSFFTALNNGRISAIIAFSRVLLFQIGAMMLLPLCFDIHGFWLALPTSEFLCLIVTYIYYIRYKPYYNY